jgi:hypothetical protein
VVDPAQQAAMEQQKQSQQNIHQINTQALNHQHDIHKEVIKGHVAMQQSKFKQKATTGRR